MQTRQLGNSDLYITPIGVGSWAIGGAGWEFAWGPQDDKSSIEAIHSALDYGVNWIDTAAAYGLGHSEEVVATALEDWSGTRPYIFTKCGLEWDDKGKVSKVLKAASVRRECEESLRRLRSETIDLYQIHWPTQDINETAEGWTEMAKLQREGKVRRIGVSNFNVEQIKRVQEIAPVTSLQPPYSLVDRTIEKEVLHFAEQENIGVIVYSPMYSGLLSGAMTSERAANLPEDDWRRRDPNFQEPMLSHNLRLAEVLRAIGARHGRTPGEAAIAWTLREESVTGAIVGVRRPDQVEGIIKAADFRLNSDEIAELDYAERQKPRS